MLRKFIWIGLFALASCQSVAGTCPDKSKIESVVKEFTNSPVEVSAVRPAKVKGLCEVVIKMGAQPVVFYTDSKMEYLILGNLVSVKEKKSITEETKKEFSKVSQNVLDELSKHTDITYGKGDKYIYFITDPDCPFCKRSESIVKEWADKNGVQIRVILFPLPIHPDAFNKSVALVCEKRSFEDYINRNFGNTQCEDGKKKIQENLDFLANKLGVRGTPTFIGMNGKIHSGVPAQEDLNSLIR
ncbi:DsbC family protein [Thermocrinis minervae]|uniref:Thiol:disulfide interchange protein DsbC n=1 Tax=Thermocrinis minervae TaxID=381751 RepID=A0A1M6TAX7_9AQUI|nr:DsbC family protein [Thermocrinis minervae]SHK54029.1 Thiol:disulfide interchange protein DsbC [Thermocrinis minervae]